MVEGADGAGVDGFAALVLEPALKAEAFRVAPRRGLRFAEGIAGSCGGT